MPLRNNLRSAVLVRAFHSGPVSLRGIDRAALVGHAYLLETITSAR